MILICSGCNTPDYKNLNIYQPETLELVPGVSIQTKNGIYTPQVEETWYSEKSYKELVRSNFFER